MTTSSSGRRGAALVRRRAREREILAWQTERFLALETHREGHVVLVRPEQVVEIAFDGVQRSSRYPGGMALRFARVLRYRDDKTADEADTVETVRAIAGRGDG